MKKYLMTTLSAVALSGLFTGCSNEIETNGDATVEQSIIQTYENAFLTRFGQPAENQTWGFGDVAGTRGVNANGNEWGSTYRVPTQLTAEQKDIVRQYFQQNRYPAYNDPGWTDYFIQQVYKGGTNTTGSLSTEQYQSANEGWVVGSDHMDHLASCNSDRSIKDHIYNFNFGTCSTYPDILNTEGVEYANVSGNYHPDEIQLMVGSTTAKFGYFNSDGSLGHTEYTGLVSWTTIRTWANGKGLNGDCLNDGWNRSFMGFDFEQVVGDDVYAHNSDKSVRYATYADCPSFDYLWDGQNTIGVAPSTQTVTNQTDILSTKNWYVWDSSAESITNNEDGTKTYHAKQWGGMAMSMQGEDWSSYNKLVIEFSSPIPCLAKIEFLGASNNEHEAWANAGAERIEADLSWRNLSNVTQIALQSSEGGKDFYIKRIYLESTSTVQTQGFDKNALILVDGNPIPMLVSGTNEYCGVNGDINQSGLYTSKPVLLASGQTQNWDCLDYTVIQQKVRDGYLPVVDGTMCKWVKVQGGADGYYSDWIVTLCEAKQNGEEDGGNDDGGNDDGGNDDGGDDDGGDDDGGDDDGGDDDGGDDEPEGFVCRIIVEDLTVGENSDFDFNDVVFDVYQNGDLVIRAIGGQLPLYVEGVEVHAVCGVGVMDMVNTGWHNDGPNYNRTLGTISTGRAFGSRSDAKGISIVVHKNDRDIQLFADKGKVASMIAVGSDFEWCNERLDIDAKFHKADGTKLFQQYVIGNLGDNWENGTAWYQLRGK